MWNFAILQRVRRRLSDVGFGSGQKLLGPGNLPECLFDGDGAAYDIVSVQPDFLRADEKPVKMLGYLAGASEVMAESGDYRGVSGESHSFALQEGGGAVEHGVVRPGGGNLRISQFQIGFGCGDAPSGLPEQVALRGSHTGTPSRRMLRSNGPSPDR